MNKTFFVFAFVLATLACLNSQTQAAPKWPIHSGAWFDVQYPPGFAARRVHQTWAAVEDKYDAAFFSAPDKSVEFYVYSPQWNGEPTEMALLPRREVLVSQQTRRREWGRDFNGEIVHRVVARWFTARAKDGSYWRSWLDIEDVGIGTRKTFGIKYRDHKAYARYKFACLRFKNSLDQHGD